MKLKNIIILVITLFTLNSIVAQDNLITSHPFSGSWVITAEGGLNIGATDFQEAKMDYLGRGSIEYFLPTNSSSVFGAKVFAGAGYVAGKGNTSVLPSHANIDEFRTKIVFGGLGLNYSLSLGKVVQPYLFAGISYFIFNPLQEDGTKMPRNANGEYADNDIDYMGEIGIRFLISNYLSLNVGYTLNYLVTDDIDDVNSSKNDAYHSLFGGVSYYFLSSSDSDGDGIKDSKDVCKNTPKGVVVDEFGCPIDSDTDGIPDYLDLCPETPNGVIVDSNGCPIDSDKDGVADYLDKCPETPENVIVDNNGCEKIIVKAPLPKAVEKESLLLILSGQANFQFGKADLLPNPISGLDKLSDFIKANPSSKWIIEGHTDNRGQDNSNIELSLNRANSVLNYFIGKGLTKDRFEVIGSGSSKPIADNSIEFGRALNRRVVIEEEKSFKERNKRMLTIKTNEYNLSNEYNIESLIFTDDKYYCIQVSSWKTKLKAEKEVSKLLAKGHSAFVMYDKSTNENQEKYRVRVGYFDNLLGAREYQKRIR